MTQRQYMVWEAWDRVRWNEPDRTDHYVMQVAAAKLGCGVDEMKLEWTWGEASNADIETRKKLAVSQVGGKVTYKVKPRDTD